MHDDVGHEMVRELGIDPGLDVDDDQRFETLRRFHQEDAERDARKHDAPPQQPPKRP